MEQQRKYIPSEWIGKKYGHLTIVGYSNKYFDCVCDCGNLHRAKPTHLFSGKVQTCGSKCIYHNERYDNRSNERLYATWKSMIDRCYNPKASGYYLYGGRGITICDLWLNDFWAFNKWALENGYQEGLTIDRINSDGNYEPNNCRWATRKQQRANQHPAYTFKDRPTSPQVVRGEKFDIFGESLTMRQISEKYGLSQQLIKYRVKIGMTLEEAVTAPKHFKNS